MGDGKHEVGTEGGEHENTSWNASASMGAGSRLTRRRFLAGAAGAAVAVGGSLLAGGADAREPLAQAGKAAIPAPDASGIEHVVLVMMENRSFDHFLGWLPGANGRQAGLHYPDPAGVWHATYPLAPDYQGCGHPDPDHSYAGGRIEYDGGACDGWLLDPNNDLFAIGYYRQADLAFLGQAAPYWTSCDSYFAAILAPTYPNRIYQHAAQTDRITNSTTISTLPTIWDLLAANGVSGTYYYSDVPVLALWGAKYLSISQPIAAFFADCAAGTLPQVSFVDLRFEDENSGTSGDDHPHADIRNGAAFLASVYNAVTQGAAWGSTLLILSFDEWGGSFDHVRPTAAPIPPADSAAGNTDGLRGFRVPALLISPWSPRRQVAHTLYDHTSVLTLIEWRWGLPPLTVRDATAANLATALDFTQYNTHAQAYLVPAGPFGGPCPTSSVAAAGATDESQEWAAIRTLALQYGWTLG